jgi:hypothetical protein
MGLAGAVNKDGVHDHDNDRGCTLQADIYHVACDVRQEHQQLKDEDVFDDFEEFLAEPGMDCIGKAAPLVERITNPKLRMQMLDEVTERRRHELATEDAHASAAATNLRWGRVPCGRVADPSLGNTCRKCHNTIQRYVRQKRSKEERHAEREGQKKLMRNERLAYMQKLQNSTARGTGKHRHPLSATRSRLRRELRRQQPSRPTRVEEPEESGLEHGLQQMVLNHQRPLQQQQPCLECGVPVVVAPGWPSCSLCEAIVCSDKCANMHVGGNHGPCVRCSRTTPQHTLTVCQQCGELLCFPCQNQGFTCPHEQTISFAPHHAVMHLSAAEDMDFDGVVDILH